MSGYEMFDRQYRFGAGPKGSSGFEIGETPKGQIPIHISFSFQKSDRTSQNTGKIEIWNLNSEHLAALDSKDCIAYLKAGYGSNLPLIFTGIVSLATTTLDNADRKTEIEVIDSMVEIRDTYVSISYNGLINWKRIFDDTAEQMGVAISYSKKAKEKFIDISNGFTFVGKAKIILDKGCKCCGLSWSIQNGVLQVKEIGGVMTTESYVLSSETGLIGVPAKVVISEDDTTKEKQMGWDVEYFLNGAINIDDRVSLESDVAKGTFRVYSIEHQGDNISGDWISKARLLEVKKEDA